MRPDAERLTRRDFLVRGARGAGWMGAGLFAGTSLLPVACSIGTKSWAPLLPSDANGLRLRPGFRSRVVAVSGDRVGATSHVWHESPDGGAVFSTSDGGWVYVSNSEVDDGKGGVGAIRFAQDGSIANAYSILGGTTANCAGGATPWKTWLSCEETADGEVYECDAFSPGSQGVRRLALGVFRHEAVAVDPIGRRLYLTEDEPDGLFYRFTPSSYPSLSHGQLEAAEILALPGKPEIALGEKRSIRWHPVGDPRASSERTRFQVVGATRFDGGEGCDYGNGLIYFSTKGDDRVWKLDPASNQIEIVYEAAVHSAATSTQPILSGVDNVLVLPSGDVYVAEDPGQQQIVVLSPSGRLDPLVQVTGHAGSEVTGPALSPDGTRLYFSSQRNPGTTFEVMGPF